jgi:RNA polymerase-binding transcription factor DksA
MMTPVEIGSYRRLLMALANRYGTGVSDLRDESLHGLGGESGGGLSNLPTHMADLGNASYEEDMTLTLLENQERLLEECNAALARMEAGTFGVCEECHRPISRGRLEAFPDARYCVRCARKMETLAIG